MAHQIYFYGGEYVWLPHSLFKNFVLSLAYEGLDDIDNLNYLLYK